MAFSRKPHRYARHRNSVSTSDDVDFSIAHTINGVPQQVWLIDNTDREAAQRAADSLEAQLRNRGERDVRVSMPPAANA